MDVAPDHGSFGDDWGLLGSPRLMILLESYDWTLRLNSVSTIGLLEPVFFVGTMND